MLARAHDTTQNNWLPDYLTKNVAGIDFAHLEQRGVKRCFIDIDGTITPRGGGEVDEKTLQNLRRMKLPLFIATNRLNTTGLAELATRINAEGFITPQNWRGKPSRAYYRNALSRYGFAANETAMIGDRLLQDVWGANRAGLVTVFVTHRFDANNSRFEHWLDRWQERLIKRWARFYRVD